MIAAFESKGNPRGRILFFPNWTKSIEAESDVNFEGAKAAFCERAGLDPARPLAIYSGNLGEKQGLGLILDAAMTPGGAKIQWVIAGDGAGKEVLKARKEREGLANVSILPLQPSGQFEQMLHAADACLVTQQSGSGQFFFPSKLLTLLAHGRPVVAAADTSSELALAIQESDFGDVVSPGDAVGLADAVAKLAAADIATRRRWSDNGRRWVAQFAPSKVLSDFEAALVAISGGG